eukprot:365588-Chlamydomonas_euryale.AAC.3
MECAPRRQKPAAAWRVLTTPNIHSEGRWLRRPGTGERPVTAAAEQITACGAAPVRTRHTSVDHPAL